MYTGKYRIVQTSDYWHRVQELHREARDSFFPWVKRRWVEKWEDTAIEVKKAGGGMLYPMSKLFATEAEAQKWIDDKRKYPLVIADRPA